MEDPVCYRWTALLHLAEVVRTRSGTMEAAEDGARDGVASCPTPPGHLRPLKPVPVPVSVAKTCANLLPVPPGTSISVSVPVSRAVAASFSVPFANLAPVTVTSGSASTHASIPSGRVCRHVCKHVCRHLQRVSGPCPAISSSWPQRGIGLGRRTWTRRQMLHRALHRTLRSTLQ